MICVCVCVSRTTREGRETDEMTITREGIRREGKIKREKCLCVLVFKVYTHTHT